MDTNNLTLEEIVDKKLEEYDEKLKNIEYLIENIDKKLEDLDYYIRSCETESQASKN